ncbi:MAG: hypothetical protein ACFCU6_04945 [Balneolaceae bacterium]
MHKNKYRFIILLVFGLILTIQPILVHAQPDPRGALLRSVVVPGWGHHYVDKTDWTRGQVHLAADVVLLAAFFGLNIRSNNLQDQAMTLAQLRAGVNAAEKDRAFRLAIGRFNSLEEHNDFQLRSRNFDQLIEDTPSNRWRWASSDDRNRYSSLRDSADRIDSQLPAFITLLVANRVVAGVSAFVRAKNKINVPEISISPVIDQPGSTSGLVANIRIAF